MSEDEPAVVHKYARDLVAGDRVLSVDYFDGEVSRTVLRVERRFGQVQVYYQDGTTRPDASFYTDVLVKVKGPTEGWPQVDPLRKAIITAERHVTALHDQRAALIVAMVRAGMTRREIGTLWGVSNVAITHIVNKRGGTAAVTGEES